MNVAVTVWGNRISPVFDSAQTLLVVDIRKAEIVDRKIRLFQATLFNRFLKLLEDMEVRVLICGALSRESVRQLAANDIEVISFIAGETERILELYIQERDLAQFAMPGCQYGRCCRGRERKSLVRDVKNDAQPDT
jgi:predicted Fe-Mo cluster-binding NifX family protein